MFLCCLSCQSSLCQSLLVLNCAKQLECDCGVTEKRLISSVSETKTSRINTCSDDGYSSTAPTITANNILRGFYIFFFFYNSAFDEKFFMLWNKYAHCEFQTRAKLWSSTINVKHQTIPYKQGLWEIRSSCVTLKGPYLCFCSAHLLHVMYTYRNSSTFWQMCLVAFLQCVR